MVPVRPEDNYVTDFREARIFLAEKWKKPTLIIYSDVSLIYFFYLIVVIIICNSQSVFITPKIARLLKLLLKDKSNHFKQKQEV